MKRNAILSRAFSIFVLTGVAAGLMACNPPETTTMAPVTSPGGMSCRGSYDNIEQSFQITQELDSASRIFSRYRILTRDDSRVVFEGVPTRTTVLTRSNVELRFTLRLRTHSTAGAPCISAQELMNEVTPRVVAYLRNPAQSVRSVDAMDGQPAELQLLVPLSLDLVGGDTRKQAQLEIAVDEIDFHMTETQSRTFELFMNSQRLELSPVKAM